MAKINTKQKKDLTLSSMTQVLNNLNEDIISGKIVPGQRLISSEMAAKMGTSLAPVREAFHVLAGEGMLEILPNRGVRVRLLSSKNLLEGIQVLKVVGALAINLASKQKITAKDKQNLVKAMKKVYHEGEQRNPAGFFKSISTTHRMMNDLADNSYLNPVVNRLHLEYFNSQLSEILPGNWDKYIANYRRLGELFEAGENKKLEKEFVKHCDWVGRLLQTKIDQESK